MQEDNTMTFSTVARQRILRLSPSVIALLVVPAILAGENLSAQTQTPQGTTLAQQQKAVGKPAQARRHVSARPYAASTQPVPAPEAIAEQPPTSPAPILPANQAPNQARVSWDSRGLEIEASNSSLNEILHQVAAATGAKLEGLAQDQRVFGSYGPGPECDVLSKLLDGSGYNVLMIGSRDADAPLEIVLSARSPASPQTVANNQNRDNSADDVARKQHEPEPPPVSPTEPSGTQSVQNPFGNGEPPRDSLQFMQEILERQQKIDQQQQQDQENNPH
jgi:hypothetical protein